MSGGGDKPKPTKQERMLAARSAGEWNRYVQDFIPMENRLIADIQDSEKYAEEARGIAATDVGLQSTGQLDNASGALQGQSGLGLKRLTNLAANQGAAKGQAIANAEDAIKERELKGLADLSGFGRGLSGMNMQSLGGAASNAAARSLNQYNFDARLKSNYGKMAGQVLGVGLSKAFPKPGGYESAPGFIGPPSSLAGGG